MVWKPIPDGTRVRHSHHNFEGYIDGLTYCHDNSDLNPDGKTQYRVRIHGKSEREFAVEHELQICEDVNFAFRSTEHLRSKVIQKPNGEEDKKRKELLIK
jgi:hypothetical protein